MTDTETTQQMAKVLSESFGERAPAEAARRAREAEGAGQTSEAEDWRRVQHLLEERRGPHES